MTTNISKEKRDSLVAKINEIKKFIQSSLQDKNTASLLTYISEIEKDIKGKKYGLVFEEHREIIDEILENNVPILKEDESLFIDNGGQMNFLIEGDNLASLKLLEKTHKGKIDFIYIDPPYNTGHKDFIYDDDFITNENPFIHSKWLSFMKKRLLLAKKILSKNGVIFISIDDNEYSNLKLLCDSIWSSENYVGTFIRKTVTQRAMAKYYNTQHEYCLLYCNNKINFPLLGAEKDFTNYSNPDNDPNGDWKVSDPTMRGSTNFFEIKNPYTGKIDIPPIGRGWAFTKEKLKEHINSGKIVFKKHQKNNERGFIYKAYKNNLRSGNLLLNSLDFCDNAFLNQVSSKEIIKIFDTNKFDYAKPEIFIENLIKYQPNKYFTILDFFAGSGTTGHAVMKLNAEDGGNRKFILCTNNENNICRDVTYERIKRVIEKEKYKASLKYMKVDFVPISDKFYYEYADELLKNIKELVELENGINFKGNKEIAIILTEEELDTFTKDIPVECKSIYLGHNILPTDEQEKLFKDKEIKINIIPDYYYRELED
jgi:adenine-specific DNA-methyltransferase